MASIGPCATFSICSEESLVSPAAECTTSASMPAWLPTPTQTEKTTARITGSTERVKFATTRGSA